MPSAGVVLLASGRFAHDFQLPHSKHVRVWFCEASGASGLRTIRASTKRTKTPPCSCERELRPEVNICWTGVFLVHWGKSGMPRISAPPNPLNPKAPFDRAAEAGHVMRMDRDR